MKKIFLLLVVYVLATVTAKSQVSVYPPISFLDDKHKSTILRVKNVSQDFREIEVEFKFGYVDTDEYGKIKMVYNDSTKNEQYSIDKYLKVFPKKLVVPPGEEQMIRILTRNTKELKDGAYWTRIIARSTPIVEQVDSSYGKKEVGAKFLIVSEMVTLLVFRKGKNESGVDFSFDRIYKDSSSTNLLFDFTRTGNSPFWGEMITEILNEDDEVIAENKSKLPIYFDSKKLISFESDQISTGTYKARITVNNEMIEVPEKARTPFTPVVKEITIQVP